ncbi:unnamed protein product [Adineta steineri]|uniref:Uncharacterized protein n=1 Tax=Adineta steineri TaxID=433720 RepID=A0A814DRQ0_9BILA|nr:unnamed protein product [Adineta steineri]CAF1006465.1 unnamed protein product [Adineta steineri]
MNQSTLFILSAVLIQLTSACFITNCPIGGKRSLLLNNNHHKHECPSCGFNGQCFGPSICCTSLSCRIGHPSDIHQCTSENRSPVPCTIKSAVCSAVPNGRCAANGICCGTDSCQMDKSCSISSNQDDESPSLST